MSTGYFNYFGESIISQIILEKKLKIVINFQELILQEEKNNCIMGLQNYIFQWKPQKVILTQLSDNYGLKQKEIVVILEELIEPTTNSKQVWLKNDGTLLVNNLSSMGEYYLAINQQFLYLKFDDIQQNFKLGGFSVDIFKKYFVKYYSTEIYTKDLHPNEDLQLRFSVRGSLDTQNPEIQRIFQLANVDLSSSNCCCDTSSKDEFIKINIGGLIQIGQSQYLRDFTLVFLESSLFQVTGTFVFYFFGNYCQCPFVMNDSREIIYIEAKHQGDYQIIPNVFISNLQVSIEMKEENKQITKIEILGELKIKNNSGVPHIYDCQFYNIDSHWELKFFVQKLSLGNFLNQGNFICKLPLRQIFLLQRIQIIDSWFTIDKLGHIHSNMDCIIFDNNQSKACFHYFENCLNFFAVLEYVDFQIFRLKADSTSEIVGPTIKISINKNDSEINFEMNGELTIFGNQSISSGKLNKEGIVFFLNDGYYFANSQDHHPKFDFTLKMNFNTLGYQLQGKIQDLQPLIQATYHQLKLILKDEIKICQIQLDKTKGNFDEYIEYKTKQIGMNLEISKHIEFFKTLKNTGKIGYFQETNEIIDQFDKIEKNIILQYIDSMCIAEGSYDSNIYLQKNLNPNQVNINSISFDYDFNHEMIFSVFQCDLMLLNKVTLVDIHVDIQNFDDLSKVVAQMIYEAIIPQIFIQLQQTTEGKFYSQRKKQRKISNISENSEKSDNDD